MLCMVLNILTQYPSGPFQAANVLMTNLGECKLGDFGLAKVTASIHDAGQ